MLERSEMGGFGFTEEQERLRREVQIFAQREVAPRARERPGEGSFPREMLKRIADLGFLSMNFPKEYGGQPADWVSMGITIEELAKVDTLAGLFTVYPMLAALALGHGSEEVCWEWLPPLVRGDKIVCLAATEPDCGSDAAAMKSSATRDGDYYILNGEKTSISAAMEADFALAFAKTDPAAGARGISCFLVPLHLPGISRSPIRHMGIKRVGTGSITLQDVRIPAKYLLGDEGKGFYIIMDAFDFLRLAMALAALGAAQASFTEAVAYAKTRSAFGRPIAGFEGISFRIAEDAMYIEAARLLCYRALWLRDQRLPHTKESAMAKFWCPQVAERAIHNALLIHGHVGYSEEYPIERRLRDAVGFELMDGTAEIMKIIIAQEIIGRESRPY